MLVRNTKCSYRHKIEQKLGKECSGKEVLDHIFGTYENDYQNESDFVLRVWSSDSRTKLHRLNMFWAIPLTILLSPYTYIKNGCVGWDTKTALGRFILRVTGHLSK